MEINISIGERLREMREAMGCTQTEFAGYAARMGVPGVTRQSQAKYEKGLQSPSAAYLFAVSQVGLDVGYVITGKNNMSPGAFMSPEEQMLLRYFREASPDVRRAALGALLGASVAPRGSNITQQSSGDNAKHYGDIQGGIKIDKRKRG